MNLGERILNFYNFCFLNNFECGISWFENEFHINVTSKGMGVICSAQQKTLSGALDECLHHFRKVGLA